MMVNMGHIYEDLYGMFLFIRGPGRSIYGLHGMFIFGSLCGASIFLLISYLFLSLQKSENTIDIINIYQS